MARRGLMTVEDMEANRKVRAVFARNWVNLQRLDYSTTHGTVYVRGRMLLLHEPAAEPGEERDRNGVGPKLLYYLEKQILKVEGVHAVAWSIEGWQRTGESWMRGRR
jgi:hypothetical protein